MAGRRTAINIAIFSIAHYVIYKLEITDAIIRNTANLRKKCYSLTTLEFPFTVLLCPDPCADAAFLPLA